MIQKKVVEKIKTNIFIFNGFIPKAVPFVRKFGKVW
jgi:hypothetical protein